MESTSALDIRGRVLHVIYTSPNWSSVQFENLDSKEHFSAVGAIPSPIVNQVFHLTGGWKTHPRYGLQFSVSSCTSEGGTSPDEVNLGREEIIRFLASDFIKGLGYSKACAVYDTFGKDSLRIIEKQFWKLTTVPGIGKTVAQTIHDSFTLNKHYWELRCFLKDTVTDHQIKLIYTRYGEKAIPIIQKDPYRLIDDIEGIGFLKADKIARAAKLQPDASCRVQGAVVYLLQEAASEGHCYSFHQTLAEKLTEVIGDIPNVLEVAANAIKRLKDTGRVVVEKDGAIYLKSLWEQERFVAESIKKFKTAKPKCPITPHQVQAALRDIRRSIGFDIEETQQEAVEFTFNNMLSVITGGPGTGKTTTIKSILHVWTRYYPISSVMLMAPTGKASRRITEVTGIQAYTIHQSMHRNMEDIGLVICDEGSMIDILVASMLFQCLPEGIRLVILGDADQLPAIGPGNFFRDILECYTVPSVRLKVSFRSHGSIAANAARVNEGKGVHSFRQDEFFHFTKADKDSSQQLALDAYLSLVGKYGVANVCLLSPKRKKGPTCTNTMNELIQRIVNPPSPTKQEIDLSFMKLREGDRIVCNENLWKDDVANGDTGTIKHIDLYGPSAGAHIQFDSGVESFFTRDMLAKLSLAYSLTIHKSQGSEYKGVVIIFTTEHWFMGQRNLLYTAMTRAKEELSFVGDPKSIAVAASKVDPIFRNTKLKERLTAA